MNYSNIAHTLGGLLSRDRFLAPTSHSETLARRRRFQPVLETLEDRLAPAVNTSLNGGVLSITADAADNVVVSVFSSSTTDESGKQVIDFNIVVDGQQFDIETVNKIELKGVGDFANNFTFNGFSSLDLPKTPEILIDGGPGNDVIRIGVFSNGIAQGKSEAKGGPGDDRFLPQVGSNLLIGGSGNDIYDYSDVNTFSQSVNDTIRESGGAGADNDKRDKIRFRPNFGYTPNKGGAETGVTIDISSSAQQVVADGITIRIENPDSIEDVDGTPLSDKITGNSRDNILDGGGNESNNFDGVNKDTIKGLKGNDVLRGDVRDFVLRGDDKVGSVLEGGKGNDLLISTIGNDTLRGGPDSDTYQTQHRRGSPVFGHDTIEETGDCLDEDLLLLGTVRRNDDPLGEIIPNLPLIANQTNTDFSISATQAQEVSANH